MLPDPHSPAREAIRDKIVKLVESMIATEQQRAVTTNETDRNFIESKAAGLDRQIDDLVYDLDGLTPEERALVAGT